MLSIFKELIKATKACITKQITKWKGTLKVDADALKVGEMYYAYYNQMYPELKKYYAMVEKAYNVTEAVKDKAVATYKESPNETTKTEMYKKYYISQDVIENGYVVDNPQVALVLSQNSYEAANALSENSPYNNWYLTAEKLNMIDNVLKETLALSKKAYEAAKAIEAVPMEKDSDEIVYKKEVYKEACFNAKKALDNARELTYEAHDKAWFDNKNGKTYRKLYWKSRADLWITYFTLRVYLLFYGDE
jgi:hypothetical protein